MQRTLRRGDFRAFSLTLFGAFGLVVTTAGHALAGDYVAAVANTEIGASGYVWDQGYNWINYANNGSYGTARLFNAVR